MCHPLAGGKGGTQYQRGVRDLRFESSDCRLSDGGILLSAVGCPLSAGEETIRRQTGRGDLRKEI